MGRRNATLAAAAFSAVAASAVFCAQTPPPADGAAVAQAVDGFIEALNAADIEKLTPFFAPDATAFFPLAPFAERLENRDQIVKVFAAFFESVRRGKSGPPYMTLAPEDPRIQLLGDTAVVTFHFKGSDLVSRRTLVLRRRGASWLIVHLHGSGIPVQAK